MNLVVLSHLGPIFCGKQCYLFNYKLQVFVSDHCVTNSLASGRFQGLSEKKRLNARGFAREFLWSGMLYRPGKSLKGRSKSSSLHSKKIFLLGVAGFLLVTSLVEDF